MFPTELQSLVFSYLHKPFDYEKAQVIQELNRKCMIFDKYFYHRDLIVDLMLPPKCKYCRIPSKYRYYCKHLSKPCTFCGRQEKAKYMTPQMFNMY